MKVKTIEFYKSSQSLEQCPKPNYPEYAFAGRSNVGKSTLINLITGRKKLAKTSSRPGKTQLINHFLVNDNWYLVDLPGYGYAKVSKSVKHSFNKLITQYLQMRESLACLFLLIDSRHIPLSNDLEFINWLGENNIPFALCFTKTDKIKESQLDKNIKIYKNQLLDQWESLPQIFLTSFVSGVGKKEILGFIEETNKIYHTEHN
jgi:GTP-binding protein